MESDVFVLGVDLDDVCADYTGGFRVSAAAFLGLDPRTMKDPTSWSFSEADGWGIRDHEHYLELARRAVVEHDLFANLDEIPGASDALWRLSDAGVHIRVITSRLMLPWVHDKVVSDTVAWLQAPRPDGRPRIPYRDICFVGDKTDVGADLYVDDAPHNVLSLMRKGRRVLCFDRPHNRGLSDVRRVRGWAEVEEIVLEALGERHDAPADRTSKGPGTA